MAETISCPSGLTGTIRAMKVREERALADRKNNPVDELLRACWTSTLDTGPYTFDGELPDWSRVLQGDRFFALLQLRALTFGPEYAFTLSCSDAACRAIIHWEINVNDLVVRPLSDASRSSFVAGNRFAMHLPDANKRVWFKLLVGADEQRLLHMRRTAGDAMLAAALAHRILEVEGAAPKHVRAFIDDLSMRDARAMLAEFQRVDCGVETTFEVECTACRARSEVDLPLGPKFFLPSTSTGGGKGSSN